MEAVWRPRALASDGGSVLTVNQQDQQAIDELFQYLNRAVAQAGPRDAAADALIQRSVRQGPPGLLYQMAQTLVAQQHTINQLRARLAAVQGQGGAPAGSPRRGARDTSRGTGSRGTGSRVPTSGKAGSSRRGREAASWPGPASSPWGSAAASSVPRC